MVALAFPNSFAIPLTLQLQLANEPVFLTAITPTAKDVHDHTLELYLFSYVLWIFMRWSVGFPVLTGGFQDFHTWRQKVVNPPTVACGLAMVLGILNNNVLPADMPREWAAPLATSIEYISNALVPTIQMTLGAKLYLTVAALWQGKEEGDGAAIAYEPMGSTPEVIGEGQSVSIEGQSVSLPGVALEIEPVVEVAPTLPGIAYVLLVVLRQLLGPTIGCLVGLALYKGVGVTDKVGLMVCMMQAAGPPMINLSVMAGLSGEAETEVGRIILCTYAASIITWTFSMTTFLYMLSS